MVRQQVIANALNLKATKTYGHFIRSLDILLTNNYKLKEICSLF
jgi:hypothetical protein